MRKHIILLVSSLVMLALTAGIVVYLSLRPVDLGEYRSPDGTVAVRITDDRSVMEYVLSEKSISFSATKNDRPVALNEALFSSDGLVDFFKHFADGNWEENDLLVFRRRVWRNDVPERDVIQISNFSNRDIDFLRISDLDIYLVFGLRKNDTRHVSIRKALAHSLKYLEASGSFDNGKRIKRSGMNFRYTESNMHATSRYCLRIEQEASWSECAPVN